MLNVKRNSNWSVLRRCAWAGTLFSVLAMICALNMIPLQSIGFLVTTPVIASPSRLLALRAQMPSPGETTKEAKELRLIAIRSDVGDKTKAGNTVGAELLAAQLQFQSGRLPNKAEVEDWLQAASDLPHASFRNEDTAKRYRWAKWRKDALTHSLQVLELDSEAEALHENSTLASLEPMLEHELLESSKSQLASLGPPQPNLEKKAGTAAQKVEASTDSSREPFKVASVPMSKQPDLAPSLREQLRLELQSIESELSQLESVRRVEGKSTDDVLAISRSIVTRPMGERIPMSRAAGLLAIGITSWFGMAWFYWYLSNRGGSNPHHVIAWLERVGVPLIGSPFPDALASSEEEEKAKRVCNILEWMVLFFGLWAAIRFASDPMWRMLLLEQPLAALARLFAKL